MLIKGVASRLLASFTELSMLIDGSQQGHPFPRRNTSSVLALGGVLTTACLKYLPGKQGCMSPPEYQKGGARRIAGCCQHSSGRRNHVSVGQ